MNTVNVIRFFSTNLPLCNVGLEYDDLIESHIVFPDNGAAVDRLHSIYEQEQENIWNVDELAERVT